MEMDPMGMMDMNFRSSGLDSAKRIMENMGWKEVCLSKVFCICWTFLILVHSGMMGNDALDIFAIQ
jgi:hypothetical protein